MNVSSFPKAAPAAANDDGVGTPVRRQPQAGEGAPADGAAAATPAVETLFAALDEVGHGIILLDRDLHLQFANRKVLDMFHLSRDIVSDKTTFADLLSHAGRTGAYAIPPADVDEYIAWRLKRVEEGDPATFDQRLSNGRVVRTQCAVLPHGGRMLTYSDVTDLVRHAEDLERQATTDGMTGIFNRRHFMALGDREWSRFERYHRPLTMLMIDIDSFKTINDNYGHGTGDRVIVGLSEIARRCKRESDVLARIGGDEFALLLPETEIREACTVAERLRGLVDSEMGRTDCANVSTTVSIGAAGADENMSGIGELIQVADRALYGAKQTGRNRVNCAA